MHKVIKRNGITTFRPRFRTPKRETRLYAIATLGEKRFDMEIDPTTFDQAQAEIDKITETIAPTPQERLAYNLYDLSRDLSRSANEILETREVEPANLKYLLRRMAAAWLAARLIYPEAGPPEFKAAQEWLQNPHRTKGQELP